MDGHLSHNLRVHVSPVSMPVKIRALISAVLLALHGGPGKDSLLHVPLGTPQTVAKSAGVSCTAGFGGTACGFCTRCQRHTDAAVAAVRAHRIVYAVPCCCLCAHICIGVLEYSAFDSAFQHACCCSLCWRFCCLHPALAVAASASKLIESEMCQLLRP